MKKLLAILLACVMVFALVAACANDEAPQETTAPADETTPAPETEDDTPSEPEPEDDTPPPADGDLDDVTLRLWGGEEDQAMLRQKADAFIVHVADRVNLTIELGVESESTARDTILTDPLAAADVFTFADDQVMDLYNAGVLQEVLINADDIRARNVESSVGAATVGGRLIAWPLTADNGYFMFYNAEYFTAEDIQSFDRMLEVAYEAGKQITMDLASGWYNIAFFRGAGFDAWLESDGVTSNIDINGPGGTDVVQAMLDISGHPGFISLGDGEFVAGMQAGDIIAGINGPWNATAAEEAWGDNYAASKLPTFTLGGQQVQMGGVVGHKLIGVNAFGEWVGWAMELADWLTNYDSQVTRFELRGQGPSNFQAAQSPDVQADHALAALAAQAEFSAFFAPGGNFWGAMETFGEIIRQGNPDNVDHQELLDSTVATIVD